jgi:hypothetical protein
MLEYLARDYSSISILPHKIELSAKAQNIRAQSQELAAQSRQSKKSIKSVKIRVPIFHALKWATILHLIPAASIF